MQERFLKFFACAAAAGILVWVLFHWVLPCLWPFLVGGFIAVALRPAARGIRNLTRMNWKASAATACLLFYAVFGMLLCTKETKDFMTGYAGIVRNWMIRTGRR